LITFRLKYEPKIGKFGADPFFNILHNTISWWKCTSRLVITVTDWGTNIYRPKNLGYVNFNIENCINNFFANSFSQQDNFWFRVDQLLKYTMCVFDFSNRCSCRPLWDNLQKVSSINRVFLYAFQYNYNTKFRMVKRRLG